MPPAKPSFWFVDALASTRILSCIVLALVATSLYLQVFVLPSTPIAMPSDQMIHLHAATRMALGEVIYRDFFEAYAPGTDLIYEGLIKLFGARAWIPNATLVALGLALTWITTVVAKNVIPGVSALLPGLLFACYLSRVPIPSHQWFSLLLVMCAAACIISRRTVVTVASAGGLCALAAFFSQNHGLAAVLGIATFLAWERQRWEWNRIWRLQAALLSGFLAISLPLLAYISIAAGFRPSFYALVAFPSKYYRTFGPNSPSVYGIPLRSRPWYRWPSWATLLFLNLFPLVYVAFFIQYGRQRKDHLSEATKSLLLIDVVGLFLFASVAIFASEFRLTGVLIPALIILVPFTTSLGRPGRVLLGIFWATAILFLVVRPVREQSRYFSIFDGPSGRFAAEDLDFGGRRMHQEYLWILQHTRASEFFFDADWPEMYFFFRLRNPTPIPFLTTTEYTRPEQVRSVIDGLEKHRVRLILWSPFLDVTDDGPSDHLGPLRAYLDAHYHKVKTFEDRDEIWERN